MDPCEQIIADALKMVAPAPHWSANKRLQHRIDCEAVADACATVNVNFNRSKFLEACGVDNDV